MLDVLDLLRRGHSFFSTNAELLDRYAACANASEVIQVQTEYLEQLTQASAKVPAGQPASTLFWFGVTASQLGWLVATASNSKLLSKCCTGDGDDYMAGMDLPPSSSDNDDTDSSGDDMSEGQHVTASAHEAQHTLLHPAEGGGADAQEPADVSGSTPQGDILKSGIASAHSSATAVSKPMSLKPKAPPDLHAQLDALEM